MTPPQPNKRRVKARKIQVYSYTGQSVPYEVVSNPVFVLPADPESVERMVEQVAKGISPDLGYIQVWNDRGINWNHADTISVACAALAAIGLIPWLKATRSKGRAK